MSFCNVIIADIKLQQPIKNSPDISKYKVLSSSKY